MDFISKQEVAINSFYFVAIVLLICYTGWRPNFLYCPLEGDLALPLNEDSVNTEKSSWSKLYV